MTTLNFNVEIRIENLNINPRFRLSATNSDTERTTRSEQTTGQEEEQPEQPSTGGPPGSMGFSGTTTGFSGTTTGQQGIPLFSTEFSIPVNELFQQQNPGEVGFISRFEEIIRNISTTPAENNNTGLSYRGFENTQLYIHRSDIEGEEEICAICHGNIEDGEEVRRININSCNHRFHSGCIDTWFRNHQTCPVCRTNVER